MRTGRPTFEVVTPAEVRRLIPVEVIRAITGIPSSGENALADEDLGRLIDAALSQAANSCRLAKYRAVPLTLAQEAVRATWLANCWGRELLFLDQRELLLPWRAPIFEVTVTEGGTELVENTDYRLLGSGVIERIDSCWAIGSAIVVDYTAGFALLSEDPAYQDPDDGEPMPPDLVVLFADQVRMMNDRSAIDLNLRNEDIPGVWSGSFNVAGGDAVDTCGLIMPLYDALAPYRAPPVFA